MSTTTSTDTTTNGPADLGVSEATLRAALSSRTRPPRPSPLMTSVAFGWRAVLKIKHVPTQLFDVTMFPIMFTLIFTYLFGGALAGSPRQYLQGLLPGILVMTITMITMYTGMGLNTDIHKGVFDRFRSLPIWRPAVLVGMLLADTARYAMASLVVIVLGIMLLADTARYAMASLVVIVLGIALGFRPDGGPLGVLLAVLLLLAFAFSLSWVWSVIGLTMQTPEAVMQMSMTVLFPLTFVSNVFVDTETMPGWLQSVVKVNPITHLTDAARGLMHGELDAAATGWVFGWSALFLVIFAPLTMRLYNAER